MTTPHPDHASEPREYMAFDIHYIKGRMDMEKRYPRPSWLTMCKPTRRTLIRERRQRHAELLIIIGVGLMLLWMTWSYL